MAIRLVERDEDGFESFEEVLKQADLNYSSGWTPSRYRRTCTSSPVASGSSEGDYAMVEDVESALGSEQEGSSASFEREGTQQILRCI